MSKVTRYRGSDIVPMTSVAPDDESLCDASPGISFLRWWCTREQGHDGDHEAGTPNDMRLASWPQD